MLVCRRMSRVNFAIDVNLDILRLGVITVRGVRRVIALELRLCANLLF